MPNPASDAPADATIPANDRRRPVPRRRASPAAAALLVIAIALTLVATTACLFDDSEEEFLAYCTDRYGLDYSNSDCQCYWEEMRDDDIAPKDIVGSFRNDQGVDLRAGPSQRRATERCFR